MKVIKLILTLLLSILLVILGFYGPSTIIIYGIVILLGFKIIVSCLDIKKKSYEQEIKNLEEKRDELLNKSNHNYEALKTQLEKLKNIIEYENSYYEAQKMYFYINQAINNENLIMERGKYLELVETFKKLEKKMLQLPLKR